MSKRLKLDEGYLTKGKVKAGSVVCGLWVYKFSKASPTPTLNAPFWLVPPSPSPLIGQRCLNDSSLIKVLNSEEGVCLGWGAVVCISSSAIYQWGGEILALRNFLCCECVCVSHAQTGLPSTQWPIFIDPSCENGRFEAIPDILQLAQSPPLTTAKPLGACLLTTWILVWAHYSPLAPPHWGLRMLQQLPL